MFLSYALAEYWAQRRAADDDDDDEYDDEDDALASTSQHHALHHTSQQRVSRNSMRKIRKKQQQQQHNRTRQQNRSEYLPPTSVRKRIGRQDGGDSHNSSPSSNEHNTNNTNNEPPMTPNTISCRFISFLLRPVNYILFNSIFSPLISTCIDYLRELDQVYRAFFDRKYGSNSARRKKRRATTLQVVTIFIMITLLVILLTLLAIPYLAKAQHIDNLVDSNGNPVNQQLSDSNSNNYNYNQEAPSIYTNEPQPLIYGSHESGSGEGPAYTMRSDNGNNFKLPHDSSSWSSSISPSLITAKCWNNYQNDNDCKQINVITANNAQQPNVNNQHDDSIITPVVIFESSSTIEPAFIQPASSANNNNNNNYQSPSLMAPPYFASTYRPDGNNQNVVLTRHRKPPTANDVYSAPPAGATILPIDLSHQQHTRQPPHSYQFTTTGYTTQRTKSATDGVTWPTTNEFVATPQPKKPPKTTTVGRKCRDENDEDCDEPEDDNDEVNKNTAHNNNKSNSNKDNNAEDADGDTNSEDDDDENNSLSSAKPNIKPMSGTTSKSYDSSDQISNEIGSGDSGFDDDNEDDADDDDGSELETSGSSEIPLDQTTKLVDVQTIATIMHKPHSNNIMPHQATSSSPSIVVDVEVHPTLPASFPITTTEYNLDRKINNYNQDIPTQPPAPTSSTIMPDDTFRVEPVFPSSSTPSAGSESAKSESSDGYTSEQQPYEQSTTTELTKDELDTFLPIPMPDGIGQRQLQNSVGRGSNNGGGNSEYQPNAVDSSGFSEKNKFDPANLATQVSSTTPRTLEAPWKSRPLNSHTEQWRQQQQERQRPGRLPVNDPAANNPMSSIGGAAMSISQTQQREMLPALLLYACIIILSVTAFIFIIIAFIFYRRNTARQRALMHHKANMMNGAVGMGGPGVGGGQHQMVGSMSQASQMMANMQQPGLLSTYAPTGKGLSGAMGKVTSSIVKQSSSRDNMIIAEEDEERMLSIDGEQQQLLGGQSSHKDQTEGGSILDDDSPTNSNNNNNTRQVANGSWTTDDPTTSSGSQKTTDSQQNVAGFNSSSAQGARQPYPNSLSDGRQNSSSISDSQCSPDTFSQTEQQQMNQQQQQQQPPQPQRPPAPGPPQAQYLPQCAPPVSQYPQQQPMYSVAPANPIPPQNHYPPQLGAHIDPIGRYGNNNSVIFDSNFKKPFISSRSVENLHQQHQNGFIYPDERLAHYPMVPMSSPNFQPQQTRAMMMMNPGLQQMSPSNKPNPVAFQNNIQRPYSRASLINPSVAGPNEPFLNNNNNGVYNPIVPSTHTGLQRPFNLAEFQFNSPLSPARVAMNPLATLSRRHPGLGLNRNIYSEDSSSLLTASPSLARTSSSLSFAFSTSQVPVNGRGKPQFDSDGRAYNDYTPGSPFSGTPQSVVARKDRIEPWYV